MNRITAGWIEEYVKKGTCDRCRNKVAVITGSFFNTQMICLDCCAKERAHPKYPEAKRIEHEAVLKGNMNFEGVGLPKELEHD